MIRLGRPTVFALTLAAACSEPPAKEPVSSPPAERTDTLAQLRSLVREGPFPLPSVFPCAGFDEARELEIDGKRRVVVLSCNRDGLLALFRSDGTLVATHATDGKPIVVTAFSHDESGQALDKLLVEEFSWGTGIVGRDSVIYRFTENAIAVHPGR